MQPRSSSWPLLSLLLLCLGRAILGIGQSFAGTGSTLWGVGVVGSLHIGRVISWNGIVTYGAMAMGAPLGVLCYSYIGLSGPGDGHYGGCSGGYHLRATANGGEGNERESDVISRGAGPGLALRHGAGVGFCRLLGLSRPLLPCFYDAKGWDGAAFALTLFSCAFVGTRLLFFPNGINRLGGLNVAMLCFSVEVIGLLLVGFCTDAADGESRDFPHRRGVLAGLPGAGRGGGKSRAAAQSGLGAGDLYRIYGFVVGDNRAAGRAF